MKGAFTNAHSASRGFLEAAHEGTLFLDEVAELSPAMQAKLLHAVENKLFTPPWVDGAKGVRCPHHQCDA